MTNISEELLHVGFCNLVQVLWILLFHVKENQISPTYSSRNFFVICCFMWENQISPTYSSHDFFVICCFMWENQISPTYSSRNFFIFLSLQFSNIKKFIFFFAGIESHTKLKLGLHINSRLMYHVYLNRTAGVYLFLYFFNFLSLKFQNIKFLVTLFCEAYKVETWYTHGQRVDLLCTPNTSSHFFHFSFSPIFKH